MKASLTFDYSKRVEGLGEFIEKLPYNLKYKLSTEIHKDMLENFPILQNIHEKSFISWLGHRLIERRITQKEFLY